MVQFDYAKNLTQARTAIDILRKQAPARAIVEVLHGSARVVRCWVKSRNERNPCPLLPSGYAGHSEETAGDKPEEGGDDVKSAWPLCLGLHTCYNGRHKPSRCRKVELIGQSRSQFGLQAATRLHEVGIASNRGSARRGEYVPGPCTHRPSHHESWLY